MALNTTNTSGLSDEAKTFYDRLLLKRTTPVLLHAMFGQKRNIPEHGGMTIEFRKFSAIAVATTPLTQGALFTDLKDLTVTAITATMAQYGNAVGFSDLVSTVTIDPLLTEASEILGENAGETLDELCRSVLVAGTTVQYAANKTRATLEATHIITVAEIREAVLTLKLNRARKINGFYPCIIHPRTAYDIQGTSEWVEANKIEQTGRVFDGSLGTLYGVKFWETDKAKVFTDAGNGGTVDVYCSLFFGQDAYGIVNLAKHNLQVIHKALGSAGTADALNQQSTMGWKATFAAKILDQSFMLRLEHATSTGSNS